MSKAERVVREWANKYKLNYIENKVMIQELIDQLEDKYE